MLLVAVLVGLVGFFLDRPIDIMEEPVRISLIFGSIFPMALAMAWGWRAGLVAATLGLAAMYPFAVWQSNGWANVPTCLMVILWFLGHGWAAAKRHAGHGRWWHNPYVIELVFDLLYISYCLTAFRWCFVFNPAPWAPGASTTMPMHIAWIIACKSPINGFLVVLLADVALHLAPVRRLLGLQVGNERRYDGLIVALGVAMVLVLLVVDVLIAYLLAPDGASLAVILTSDPSRMLSRLVLVAIGLAGALTVAGFIRRRLRLTQELQKSVDHQQQILKSTMDGFCLLDSAGRIIEVNSVYAQLSGFSIPELLAKRLPDLEAGESEDDIQAHMRRITVRGEDRFESRHRRKDGTTYDVEVSVKYRADQGGRFYCFVLDISDRKRSVETIELERNLYKDLVAAIPAGVYRCRVRYADPLQEDAWEKRVEISLVSDAFCHILGVARTACEADSAIVVNRIHPQDRAEFSRLNILGQTTLQPFNWEGRILRDGEVRWVHFASLPRRLEDGDVIWTGILFDTTALKLATLEQQRLLEQLHQREKIDAIGQLAGGIAHDFNNQLTGVLGYADLLISHLQDPKLAGYAAGIKDSGRRAAELTQQLLAFARKGKYRSVPTDLHRVIVEVVELLRRSVDKRITISLSLEASSSTVMGDPSQLQNLLLNLGLNARDAMPEGGEMVFSSRVTGVATDPDEDVRSLGPLLSVSVQDSGIGMDEETKRRIFEPFFTTKAVGKGTGLGLASVYGAVRNHGGIIRFTSELGRGSTFTIHLPLLQSVTATPAEPGRAARQQVDGAILIVDDEPIVLASLSELLEVLGYQVRACGDPNEAIALYRQEWQNISLVFLDMIMPGIGGRDLFLAMREINPHIKAVLSTGHGQEGEAQSILDSGVQAFLQKPFDQAALEQVLSKVFKGSAPA